jgi:hypothetical protein
MPTPCGHCEHIGNSCRVNVQSGQCGTCFCRGIKCNLLLTQDEWVLLREEKVNMWLEQWERRHAEVKLMAKKLQLRQRLARSSGRTAEDVERKLAITDQEEEDSFEHQPISVEMSFPPSPSTLPGELRLCPKDWALAERLPKDIWTSPGAITCIDDGNVFGELEDA